MEMFQNDIPDNVFQNIWKVASLIPEHKKAIQNDY